MIMRRIVVLGWALAAVMVSGARAQETGAASVEAGPRVESVVITREVIDREPVDELQEIPASTEQIFCWTDVRGAAGQTLVHAWLHEGRTRARVEFRVGGDRWRAWTSKRLLPEWTGAWEVKVLTESGRVLATAEFEVR